MNSPGDWNEIVVASAVKTLVTASETLVRATQNERRKVYVDKKFDDINRVMTTLQMILTSSHLRQHKSFIKVVK
jgi:hypothetical protein